MYCKNCGKKLIKNFCIHCGLMSNGIFINTNKPIKETDLEKYLGKEYDKIIRNQNWFISGLLGPLYILCRGNLFVGLILTIIDAFLLITFCCINHWPLFYYIVKLLNVITIFINRLFWATIGNIIYLYLIGWKINKVKNKYPNKYENILQKLHKIDLFILPIKYFITFVISCFAFRMALLYVYYLLQLL